MTESHLGLPVGLLITRLRTPPPLHVNNPAGIHLSNQQLSGEGLSASAPELELAGRCLIRLKCILGAVKSKAECLVVCVCGVAVSLYALQGVMGWGFCLWPPCFAAAHQG